MLRDTDTDAVFVRVLKDVPVDERVGIADRVPRIVIDTKTVEDGDRDA